MKCKYLEEDNVIRVSDKDYTVVIDELNKLTANEWQHLENIILDGVVFKETAGDIFDLIQDQETPQLKKISLSETLFSNYYSYLDIKKLNTLVVKNQITALNISNLYFATEYINDLIQLFKDNPQLQYVELYCSKLQYANDDQKTELFNALKSCNLKELYLSGFDLVNTDIDFLIELVEKGLLHLDIGYNEITTVGLEEFLGKLSDLTDLKLECIELDDLKVSKKAWTLIDNLEKNKAIAFETYDCKAGSYTEDSNNEDNEDDSDDNEEHSSSHVNNTVETEAMGTGMENSEIKALTNFELDPAQLAHLEAVWKFIDNFGKNKEVAFKTGHCKPVSHMEDLNDNNNEDDSDDNEGQHSSNYAGNTNLEIKVSGAENGAEDNS